MRFHPTFRTLTRSAAAATLLVVAFTVAPLAGAGAADAPVVSDAERLLQCESGIVVSDDGTQTSSATLERVSSDTTPGPGCAFIEEIE